MGKPKFVFLTLLLLHFCATEQLHGQENTANSPSSELTAPTLRAAEGGTGDSATAESSENKPATNSDTATAAPETKVPIGIKNKKPQNFYEEFFSNPLNYVLVLVVCFYIYLMFLAPKAGRKEQKERLEKLKNLKKNDRVVTTAGIHGIVSNINTEAGTITLRIDENTNSKMTIDRNSIRSILA